MTFKTNLNNIKVLVLRPDLMAHFLGGQTLWLLSSLVFDALTSVGVVLIIAVLKEAYDDTLKRRGRHPTGGTFLDIGVTGAGAGMLYLVWVSATTTPVL